jgi:methionyl-tRNA formyltransferase
MKKTIYIAGEGWGNDSATIGIHKQFDELVHCEVDGGPHLMELKGETIVFAGYKPLVPHQVIADNDCINIHYSLLPKYRGLHATVWTIINDEDYVGLTIHQMTDFIDDGPIIYQYKIENDRVKTCTEYMELLNDYIEENLGHILNDYLDGKITLIENDISKATWVGMRNHQDCKIDFNRDLNYLKCFFRALVAPYPLPYVDYKGEELSVTKVDFHPVDCDTHKGRILNIDNDGIWVKANNGYLVLKELRDIDNNIVTFDRFRIGQYFNR